jgi:hypothetical protein
MSLRDRDWRVVLGEARFEAGRTMHRQYLGHDADYALARLRDAYAVDAISLETLERVTDDIVRGRPTRMPVLPPRDPTVLERR